MTNKNTTKGILLLLGLALIWIPIPAIQGQIIGSIIILGTAIWSFIS